ncbi:MAG TPA: elongation factor Ts, partial [Saccharofermentans sp.]|nr:elongation factor Ts [Saccharofermentans sp.]
LDRIVNGSLEKFYKMNCLMEQEYVKDDSKTIETYTKEAIADIGENISIRRFARFEMGEGLEKKNEDFAEEVMKQMQK